MIQELLPQAERIAAKLKVRGETISIAESSTAGLISAALLAIPGASAYFLGGAVVYLPARSAASSPPPGRSAKPAPRGRPAAAMAMPPGIPASPSSDRTASVR